jgi:transcriptional regulator with XRE-family HTH domain
MLKQALEAAIPTQPELARAAGISYHALRQYRKGLRTPSPDVIRRIARALRQQGGKLQRLADELEAASKRR